MKTIEKFDPKFDPIMAKYNHEKFTVITSFVGGHQRFYQTPLPSTEIIKLMQSALIKGDEELDVIRAALATYLKTVKPILPSLPDIEETDEEDVKRLREISGVRWQKSLGSEIKPGQRDLLDKIEDPKEFLGLFYHLRSQGYHDIEQRKIQGEKTLRVRVARVFTSAEFESTTVIPSNPVPSTTRS